MGRWVTMGLLGLFFAGSAVSAQAPTHEHWRVTARYQNREGLAANLDRIENGRRGIQALATTPSGDWVVVSDGEVTTSGGTAGGLAAGARRLIAEGKTVQAMDVNPSGGWVVTGGPDFEVGGRIPTALLDKLREFRGLGRVVRDLDMTDDSYVMLGDGSRAVWTRSIERDFPGLARVLADRHASKRRVQQVELGPNGSWVAVSGQNVTSRGIPSRLRSRLLAMARERWWVSNLELGLGSDYVVYSAGPVRTQAASVIDRIEYSLGPSEDLSIFERMASAEIPGLSLAIVQSGQVTMARGYGVHRQGEERPVLADSRFDYASLSKYLGALAILALVDDPDVSLDLDAPIPATYFCDACPLTEWRREAERRPERYGIPGDVPLEESFTMRQLLTHTARFRTTGSARVPRPRWFELLARDMDNLLLGYGCTDTGSRCGFNRSNRHVWTDSSVASPSGTAYNYSSPGFLVAQAVAERQARKPAHRILAEKLFTPLGLKEIHGAPNLDEEFLANTVWPHSDDGPRKFRMAYPWTFSGGIFGSARDYAELVVLGLNGGVDSSGRRILSQARITEMMTLPTSQISRGLGIDVDRFTLPSGAQIASPDFFHSGSHGNRATSYMCGNRTQKDGIVILFNTDNNTSALRNEMLKAFTEASNWPAIETCR